MSECNHGPAQAALCAVRYCPVCLLERIAELEAEIKRYKRVVPGTLHRESEWQQMLARAEAAEAEVARLRAAAGLPNLVE